MQLALWIPYMIHLRVIAKLCQARHNSATINNLTEPPSVTQDHPIRAPNVGVAISEVDNQLLQTKAQFPLDMTAKDV